MSCAPTALFSCIDVRAALQQVASQIGIDRLDGFDRVTLSVLSSEELGEQEDIAYGDGASRPQRCVGDDLTMFVLGCPSFVFICPALHQSSISGPVYY